VLKKSSVSPWDCEDLEGFLDGFDADSGDWENFVEDAV